MTYKMVFLDVDGTITNHVDGSISVKTKEAIAALKRKGIRVVAATGRPLSMCSELKALGIETFITANGGYVTHNETVIHKVIMDKEIVREIMVFAHTKNHGLSFYSEGLSMNGVQNEHILRALKETLSLNEYPEMNPQLVQEVFLMCLFADEQMVEAYSQTFPNLLFRRWHPYIVNVLEKDVSKSLAIMKVLEHFKLDPSEVIAFGDGDNDIDMLELAGLGIAMGNGSEKLKTIADFVTKTSSEDGIDFALRKFGVITSETSDIGEDCLCL